MRLVCDVRAYVSGGAHALSVRMQEAVPPDQFVNMKSTLLPSPYSPNRFSRTHIPFAHFCVCHLSDVCCVEDDRLTINT